MRKSGRRQFFALLARLYYFLSFKQRKLVWGQGTKAAVRSQMIAIVKPCVDILGHLSQGDEPYLFLGAASLAISVRAEQ